MENELNVWWTGRGGKRCGEGGRVVEVAWLHGPFSFGVGWGEGLGGGGGGTAAKRVPLPCTCGVCICTCFHV